MFKDKALILLRGTIDAKLYLLFPFLFTVRKNLIT
jgi:hypothetical protein